MAVMVEVKELLRSDKEYYTGEGKKYLSNSDIGTLLKNPEMYGVSRPDNKNFAEGRYFHQLILEPEKAENVLWCESASRNTKMYKEFIAEQGVEVALLKGEKEHIEKLVNKMLVNLDFYSLIKAKGNIYEEPSVMTYEGTKWKGKADIVSKDYVVDLKTTSNLEDFKWNARKYNYDSQAYVYQQLFCKPMMFLVVEKQSGRLGMFTGNEDFYDRGKEKMHRAIEVWNKFFKDGDENKLTQHYIQSEI